jgi:hypothetical protein
MANALLKIGPAVWVNASHVSAVVAPDPDMANFNIVMMNGVVYETPRAGKSLDEFVKPLDWILRSRT